MKLKTVNHLLDCICFSVHTIGCFVCSSINHSNPDCEDVFNATGKYYKKDCMAGRKLRDGLFPGTNCIKLKAEIRKCHRPFGLLFSFFT